MFTQPSEVRRHQVLSAVGTSLKRVAWILPRGDVNEGVFNHPDILQELRVPSLVLIQTQSRLSSLTDIVVLVFTGAFRDVNIPNKYTSSCSSTVIGHVLESVNTVN